MPQQGRWFRPKPKSLVGTPYDSTTEQRLDGMLTELRKGSQLNSEFHPSPIQYQMKREYNPDFQIHLPRSSTGANTPTLLLVEVKAIFTDAAEMQKYPWVRESLRGPQELVFVFEDPDKAIHFYKKRKDGTKLTVSEWAEKNGFRWFTLESFVEYLKEVQGE